uniref:Uncharacterized protein n=1 Tax=Sexangularia sp. CB-2014 TaxID=1486929 RepID=A0A7S1YIA7_9EUKA|mmetsp:Transcript_7751/g.24859  ORF Transcript_7751/g.24859 Transcript_7751/m.24859 type:complete len:232 (+) Transcript_7751:116-811(+)
MLNLRERRTSLPVHAEQPVRLAERATDDGRWRLAGLALLLFLALAIPSPFFRNSPVVLSQSTAPQLELEVIAIVECEGERETDVALARAQRSFLLKERPHDDELLAGIGLSKLGGKPVVTLPQGRVHEGERVEDAVTRVVRQDTGIWLTHGCAQFHLYSDPRRDPRTHLPALVFVCRSYSCSAADGGVTGGDVLRVHGAAIPYGQLGFDHGIVLRDYFDRRYCRNDGQDWE